MWDGTVWGLSLMISRTADVHERIPCSIMARVISRHHSVPLKIIIIIISLERTLAK